MIFTSRRRLLTIVLRIETIHYPDPRRLSSTEEVVPTYAEFGRAGPLSLGLQPHAHRNSEDFGDRNMEATLSEVLPVRAVHQLLRIIFHKPGHNTEWSPGHSMCWKESYPSQASCMAAYLRYARASFWRYIGSPNATFRNQARKENRLHFRRLLLMQCSRSRPAGNGAYQSGLEGIHGIADYRQ